MVETLQASGVKRCYGIVGDTLNQIARAINAKFGASVPHASLSDYAGVGLPVAP